MVAFASVRSSSSTAVGTMANTAGDAIAAAEPSRNDSTTTSHTGSANARPTAMSACATEASASVPVVSVRSTIKPASGANTTSGMMPASSTAETAMPEPSLSSKTLMVSATSASSSPSEDRPFENASRRKSGDRSSRTGAS